MDFHDENADQQQKLVFARLYCEQNPSWNTILLRRKSLDHPTLLKIVRKRMMSERIPYVLDACFVQNDYDRTTPCPDDAADALYASLKFGRMLRDQMKIWHPRAQERCYADHFKNHAERPSPQTLPTHRMANQICLESPLNLPAELFDLILGFMDIKSQWAAWNVSHAWRRETALFVKKAAEFKKSGVATPIEYFQPITEDMQPTPPSDEELQMFKEQLPRCLFQMRIRYPPSGAWMLQYPGSYLVKLKYTETPDDGFFIPARLHQAIGLKPEVSGCLRLLHKATRDPNDPRLPASPAWLDLSQVEFNPYFTFLFQRRIQFAHGFCAIELLPGQNKLTSSGCVGTPFYDAICAGFATQPPCKALNIFCEDMYESPTVVFDKKGITVGQLLAGLTKFSKQAIEDWYVRMGAEVRHCRRWVPSDYLSFSPSPIVKICLAGDPKESQLEWPITHFSRGSRWLLENDKWYSTWSAWEEKHGNEDGESQWATWVMGLDEFLYQDEYSRDEYAHDEWRAWVLQNNGGCGCLTEECDGYCSTKEADYMPFTLREEMSDQYWWGMQL